MEAPIGGNKSKKKQANIREQDLAEKLGGVAQPLSGAMRAHKGDVKTDNFLIDSKHTEGDYLNLKKKDFVKISGEANGEGRIPAVHISFADAPIGVSREWVAIPLDTFAELFVNE